MRPATAAELLALWDGGAPDDPTQRAILLLALACPEAPIEELWALPVGQRDGVLLRFRQLLFGPGLTGLATCPSCGEHVEVGFDASELWAAAVAPPAGPLGVSIDGWDVLFRLPTSDDLVAAAPKDDSQSGAQLLLERCLLEVAGGGPAELPGAVVCAVADAMAAADPLADVQLAVACAVCGERWETAFDIASFLWAELDAWAGRTLHEVAALASAYGWREDDVLALGPRRREFYLRMAGG